jgi:hypothetical protein
MSTALETRDGTSTSADRKAVLDGMRRSGVSRERLDEARFALPDPVDMRRDDALLAEFGFDQNARVDGMSGNP